MLLLAAMPAMSQIHVGDVTASMSGSIAPGYQATYSNTAGSTHGWAFGGSSTLNGAYHSPNFLAFDSSFYLNQSRANSNFQSISNSSGANVSASIFAGSHYPGSVTFSKAYDSEGSYAIPGVANYVTHGNSDTFGINWSENIPDRPSLSVGYQLGRSNYSVYGTNNTGANKFHTFNLRSAYRLDGFGVGASYARGGSNSDVPEVITGTQRYNIQGNSDAYAFNVTHALPMQGAINASVNRNSWDTNYASSRTSGTINMFSTTAAMHPSSKFSVSGGINYSDNLSGQLYQQVVSQGGVVPGAETNDGSHSLDLDAEAGYSPMENLQATASIDRRTQHFLGTDYGMTSISGGASYAHAVKKGHLNLSFTLSDNNSDQSNQSSVGLNTTANYSSVVAGWHVSGNFGYSQNAQTLLVTYTNSFYHFSGTARHAWGKMSLGMSGAMARTALTQNSGTFDSSQSFNGTVAYGGLISASGSYSRASGQALTTGTGLVPIPIPPPILPSGLVSLFGGNSYAFSVSSTPVKRLVVSASYANADSNVDNSNISSSNTNKQFNSLVQYQVRKLYFTSGYSRLEQGFSTTGSKPEVVGSYFAGVSRWFNFF